MVSVISTSREKNCAQGYFFSAVRNFSRTTRNFDKVEDGWRFGGGSEAAHFFQIAIYQYITKKFCLRVEDGGTKRKKIQKSIDCDLNMDHNLSSESSREKYMSKNIRIFGVEAVWRQIILPPHLSNISISKKYKEILHLSGVWRLSYNFFMGTQ